MRKPKNLSRVIFCTLTVLVLFISVVPSAAAAPVEHLQVGESALLVRHAGGTALVEKHALIEATGPNTYLTSAAVAPWDAQRILVSTTFQGIFESTDGGVTWTSLGRAQALRDIFMGNGFYDDVALTAYDPAERSLIWVQLAQSGEVLALNRSTGRRVDRPAAAGSAALAAAVAATTAPQVTVDDARRERMELAADHISFFLAPHHARPAALARHMEFAREHQFTAVVIDFKDDNGRIVYDSALDIHRQVGAVRPVFNAREVIDTVQGEGLYLIARLVVFKDEMLYRYQNNRYALWDRRRNAPWGIFREFPVENGDGETETRQVEYWVDPFSEFVWDYNIAIARELQELGVDEIQFDYIRTPAEGRTGDIVYRFRDDSPAHRESPQFADSRVAALTTFLRRARQELTVPVSVDVFGFNGWYRMSYLGQDIAALAQYVDVVSPMLYPSHFPRQFRGDLPYLEWAEYLYREGTARGRRITGDTVLIRPYIQAFLIGGELRFEEPVYTEYLKRQIRGSLDAGASGFTLWNFSGRYYMVSRGLWFDD